MIRFGSNMDTRIVFNFSVGGQIKEHDIVGALCSSIAEILPDYDIVKLQTQKKVSAIKADLYQHKSEKVKKIITTGTITIETNLDPVDNALLTSLIESVTKVHIFEARLVYKEHQIIKEKNLPAIIKRSKELYPLFINVQKSELKKEIKEIKVMIQENTELEKIKTLGKLTLGTGFNENETIILVEGRNDVINLANAKYTNTLGIGGHFFEEEELIKILEGKKIMVFMDSDSGGFKNLVKLADLLDLEYLIPLPSGKKVEKLTREEIIHAIKNKQIFIKEGHLI